MTFARVRALVVVGMLLVVAAILVVFTFVKDSQRNPKVAAGCPEGAVVVDARLPDENKEVKLKIFNGTKEPGLAEQVASDFAHRGFAVDKKRSNAPKAVDAVATLRYGPKAVGDAWLIKAYFLQEATTEFDRNRDDDVVDVLIGAKFQQLATETEVRQALTLLGNPIPPPGTCAVP